MNLNTATPAERRAFADDMFDALQEARVQRDARLVAARRRFDRETNREVTMLVVGLSSIVLIALLVKLAIG